MAVKEISLDKITRSSKDNDPSPMSQSHQIILNILFFFKEGCKSFQRVCVWGGGGGQVTPKSVVLLCLKSNAFDHHHQDNMSVCFIPTYTPLLYSKTGVYRGLHYFLLFALKHILWVLVRTA